MFVFLSFCVVQELATEVLIAVLAFTNRLLQLKGSAAYNLTVDPDVHPIDANAKRARVEVVYVLTAVDPEV